MSKSFILLTFFIVNSLSLSAQRMMADYANLLLNLTEADSVVLTYHKKCKKIVSKEKVIEKLIIEERKLPDSLKYELFDLINSPNTDSVEIVCIDFEFSYSALIFKKERANFIGFLFECNNYIFSLDKKQVGPFSFSVEKFFKLKDLFKSVGIAVD